jgi:predicted Zn-dependent peptidase
VLSIAGDVKPEEILEKVKKYFGDIPPGPSLVKPEINVSKRLENTRGYYEDHVPQAKITMVWNVPQWGSKEMTLLDLATDILSAGKTSRLYKKLVYEDQTASNAYAYIDPMEIAGNLYMGAMVKPGESAEKVEETMNAVLQEFLEKGPTQDELDRVRSNYFSNFLKGIERIGGFGGKSDILATNEVYGGSADYYKKTLQRVADATVEDMMKVCREWLSDGKYVLVCKPFPTMKAAESGVDRSKLPELSTPVPSSFPDVQKTVLKNGLTVILARRQGVPTIVGNLVFNAGFATDALAKPGLASLAMDMLDEGTTTLDALQISEKLQLLGASVNAGSDIDASYLNFNTLVPTLDPTLDLYADILLNPSFPQKEFDRLKKEHLDDIKQEKSEPFGMALRVFPKMLYGEGHPYSNPYYGSGYDATVQSITPEDVQKFYDTWIKPNNATLIIVGDIQLTDLTAKIENKFAGWKKGDVPKNDVPQVKNGPGKKIYLIDKPEASQSVIFAGYLTAPYGQVSQIALDALNNILGGDFVSRLNMNLRENKHWSYGAGSVVLDAKAQRPYIAYVSVQMDKTMESIQEIEKEFSSIVSTKPVSDDEFNRVQRNMILQLPGRWETNRSVSGSLVEQVKFNLPDDCFKTYDARVRKLTTNELQQLSKQVVTADLINWFIVGDKAKILPDLLKLGYEITEVDADGNVVK